LTSDDIAYYINDIIFKNNFQFAMIRYIVCSSVIILLCNGAIVPEHRREVDCEDLPQEIVDDIASYHTLVTLIIDYYTKGPFKGHTYQT
jgi:hypothetical protein